jgi:predicted nucleic acid-binding protein
MLVVSNTSPISALSSIGRLSLLKAQFPKILIPIAVFDELKLHRNSAALMSIETAVQEKWIEVATPSSSQFLNILRLSLHRGEAEVIALAIEVMADVVLMDEQEGREIAIHAGLSVLGVLGILLRAKRRGEISAIKPEISALHTRARFFIAPSLESKVLSAAGE